MAELNPTQKEKLMSDLKAVFTDTEELLRLTADQTGEGFSEVRSRIKSRLSQATRDMQHLQDVTVAQVKAVGHATDEYVHENPWRAVSIAAGIGLLAGWLMSRR